MLTEGAPAQSGCPSGVSGLSQESGGLMKKVAVKFCGGCNPRYDRGAAYRRIAEELKGEAEFEIAKEGVSYDALLIIRGCTQCPYLYETIDAKERVICTSQEEIPEAVRQIRDKL